MTERLNPPMKDFLGRYGSFFSPCNPTVVDPSWAWVTVFKMGTETKSRNNSVGRAKAVSLCENLGMLVQIPNYL